MEKVTRKEIRWMVEIGEAVDITNTEIPTPKGHWEKVMWSKGKYGANGVMVRDSKTGKKYAVTARCSNLFALL